jgi:hypothetical protein
MRLYHRFGMLAAVLAASGAFAGVASAQTPFQATVKANDPSPAGCAFICGTADIAGYGHATWTWTPPSDFAAVNGPQCIPYGDRGIFAQVTFVLPDALNSTLLLNESGSVCTPGGSNAFQPYGPTAPVGHPTHVNGSWSVASATGQFAGLNGAKGNDALHAAGRETSGSYTVTPGS